MTNEKLFAMPFSKVYACYVAKAERKNRTRAEVDEILCWVTGRTQDALEAAAAGETPLGEFFEGSPERNPDLEKVTGSVCGVRVETVPDPLMRTIRRADRLIDELAKGRPMEKILRRDGTSLKKG